MTDHSMVEERDDARPVVSNDRLITAVEVHGWFRRKRPSEAHYLEIADRLTKMRWPSDPPPQPLPPDAREWYWRARMWQPTDPPLRKPDSVGAREVWDFEQPKCPGGISAIKYALQADGSWLRQDIIWAPTLPDPGSVETNGWWDEFQGAADAVDKLRASIPAMLARLKRLETRGCHDAVKVLGDALATAMPYLNPCGKHKRRTGRKQPKDWCIPTIVIADIIIKALVASGHDSPNLDRDSVVVRIVRTALMRMNYGTVTLGAVSEHLKRWAAKYGRRDGAEQQ
jgi:hypothetical protein